MIERLSLNQAEQKHILYNSHWKQIFKKYRLETWNLIFVINNPDVKILEII